MHHRTFGARHILPSLDEKLADGLESAYQMAVEESASSLLPLSESGSPEEGDNNATR